MKKNIPFIVAIAFGIFTILNSQIAARAQGTAFNFQGWLTNGVPEGNGNHYLRFRLADSPTGIDYIGASITNQLSVEAHQFNTTLDFGNVFDGSQRWLEISVAKNFNKGVWDVMMPRMALSPVPYAIYAETAGSASNILGGVSTSSLTGTIANNQLANSAITINAGTGLSGGGTVALGGSLTLNVLGGISASNLTGTIANNQLANNTITINAGTGLSGGGTVALGDSVTLNINADSANTANAVVQRDSFGNFSANSLTLGGVLNLPDPATIYSGGGSLLYFNSAAQNIFLGRGAGNPTRDGGVFDTAIGSSALFNNIYGDYNTADGALTLYSNTSGGQNTAIGHTALYSNTSGSFNTANGTWALSANTNGMSNTANGWQALQNNISGSFNTADGANTLAQLETGSNNIALGFSAGVQLITGNYNIDIGNTGIDGDSGIIRIGNPNNQTTTYLVGDVYGNSFNATSDRNAKENFVAVNPQQVLAKVTALPVTEWNYKTEKNAEHIGPVAQDFQMAFGLNGKDDKHISLIDEGGVALAAIQGLNQKLDEKVAEIEQLKQNVAELKAMVAQLKSQNEKQ